MLQINYAPYYFNQLCTKLDTLPSVNVSFVKVYRFKSNFSQGQPDMSMIFFSFTEMV